MACISSTILAAVTSDACNSTGGRVPLMYVFNNSVQFFFDVLARGEIFQMQLAATIIQNVQPEQVFTNDIAYSFDSSPYTDFAGKYYSFTSSQSTTINQPSIVVTTLDSSDQLTAPPDMTIQEAFILSIALTMPECISNTSFRVAIPTNFQFTGANIFFIGANIMGSLVDQNQSVGSSPNFSYDNASNTLNLYFGLIENMADNVANVNDTILVREWFSDTYFLCLWLSIYRFILLGHMCFSLSHHMSALRLDGGPRHSRQCRFTHFTWCGDVGFLFQWP